jgi:hypothetical protein
LLIFFKKKQRIAIVVDVGGSVEIFSNANILNSNFWQVAKN